jgi:hypothetical protein
MRNAPIACSLNATAMSTRLDDFANLATHAALERRTTADGVQVQLRASPTIERRTRELVAAEASCCPFLDFDLRREDGALVLDIAGPPEARPVIDALFQAT